MLVRKMFIRATFQVGQQYYSRGCIAESDFIVQEPQVTEWTGKDQFCEKFAHRQALDDEFGHKFLFADDSFWGLPVNPYQIGRCSKRSI